MSPRTGRPKSEHAKSKLLQVRMDDEYMTLLDECAAKKETSRSEIVREGILLVKQALDDQALGDEK